jgi:hypothetical protein
MIIQIIMYMMVKFAYSLTLVISSKQVTSLNKQSIVRNP